MRTSIVSTWKPSFLLRKGYDDSTRSELGKGPDVNDDYVTRDEPFRQLAAANLLEPVTVAEVRGG